MIPTSKLKIRKLHRQPFVVVLMLPVPDVPYSSLPIVPVLTFGTYPVLASPDVCSDLLLPLVVMHGTDSAHVPVAFVDLDLIVDDTVLYASGCTAGVVPVSYLHTVPDLSSAEMITDHHSNSHCY